MDALVQDLRYALRQLRGSPGFTLVVVLTLALGIGANTAVFSVANAVLLGSMPYRDAARLVGIASKGQQGMRLGVSYPDVTDLRAMPRDFSAVSAYNGHKVVLSGAFEPREIQAAQWTSDLFATLGVAPVLGRPFTEAEQREPFAVLSHALWSSAFGRDSGAIGKSLSLDGKAYTVLGVMPADFRFPGGDVDVLLPIGGMLADRAAELNRGFHAFNVVARLADGTSFERARGDVDALARRISAGTGKAAPSVLDNGFAVSVLRDGLGDTARARMFLLLGAVALVLLIACANAANLMLARSAGRSRAVAIRAALGAGRCRLVRQVLVESVLLSLIAAGVGLLLAGWTRDAVLATWPQVLPRGQQVVLDARVLAFTALVAVLSGIAFGLAPALRAPTDQLEQTLRSETPATTSARRRRLQDGLVVAELALALVLLVGAGLVVQSLVRLNSVDPGFDTRNVVAAQVRLATARFPSPAARTAFFDGVLAELRRNPDVASASLGSVMPLSGGLQFLIINPREVRPDHSETNLFISSANVAPDYFGTLRIPLKRGRGFTADDRFGAPPAVIVNESLVRQLWPGQDPIGKKLPMFVRPGLSEGVIVGVVGSLRTGLLEDVPEPQAFINSAQLDQRAEAWLVVRSVGGSPERVVAALRDAVRRMDRNQPLSDVATLGQLIERQTASRRFSTTLLGLFALLAVGLALIGVYGVTAFTVAQRTREIGVRGALGARPADILGLLMKEGAIRISLGATLGILGALVCTRLLTSLLFEIQSTDLVTFGTTAVLLVIVALVSTYLPARRAASVDPVVALRTE